MNILEQPIVLINQLAYFGMKLLNLYVCILIIKATRIYIKKNS
ncbi:hypothetical protein [Romboutsia lituseburensis]|nr:hypothetical protein [Romboutsia lituseburensis]MCR8747247.1 hypothetical protein [Romboutsia lituseburensis]